MVYPMDQNESGIEGSRPEYEVYRLEWLGIGITIRHCRAWFQSDADDFVTQHVEVISDGRVGLPITGTGYRSHFLNGDDALAGFDNDPVTFVLAWLDEAARSPEWQAGRQLSLF